MKKNQKKQIKLIITIIFFFISLVVFCFTEPIENTGFEIIKSDYKEGDYVKEYCKGKIEYVLPDKTRIDCLTDEYAIEYDWAKKWAEGVGQSLYYSKMTGKKPAVALIIKSPDENKYAERIKKADSKIEVFIIKAKDYHE